MGASLPMRFNSPATNALMVDYVRARLGTDTRIVSSVNGRDGLWVSFSIEDDGAGFEPSAVQRGSGLTNLESRVAALGGHVRVEARAGQGTRVSGAVPV